MEKLTLTVQEVAELLGVHHLTVRGAIKRGELPAVTVGRRVLVSRRSLESFLNEPESSSPEKGTPPDGPAGE